MARSKQPGAATEMIRIVARRNLAKRAGLPVDASTEQLRAAADAIKLEPDETDAVLAASLRTGNFTRENLIAADRALAKITRGEL